MRRPKEERQMLAGLLVQVTSLVNGNSVASENVDFNGALQQHLGMFSTSHPDNFSQSSTLHRGTQIATDRTGGLRSIRLKSGRERGLLDSKSKGRTCKFCRSTGHSIGSKCAAIASFRARYLHTKPEKFRFSATLGDSAVHLVEHAPVALIRDVFQGICWAETLIPRAAHHIVIKKVYFSAAFSNQSRVRHSAYARQATNLAPPSREDNIVEIICLEEGGSMLPDEEDSPNFISIATMKAWIQASSSKKVLLSQLNAPNKGLHESEWQL
jgi:hypothetical protein